MLKGLLSVLIVIMLGITAYLGFFIYNTYYSNPETLKANFYNTVILNSTVEQFYPNMRYASTQINFYLGGECSSEKRESMLEALNFLENKTQSLDFRETSLDSAQLEIRCGQEYEKEGMLVAGEGGPRNIINTTLFTLIVDGQILLLYNDVACPKERYNVELHELLHALGFDHSTDKNNVMYNVTSCGQAISENTIQELKELYSIESLADLYFKDITAIKHGGYLDLNFTISNRGLASSNQVSITLDSGTGKEEIYNFTELAPGEGRFIWMQNIKIPLSTSKASLLASDGKELDYKNNLVDLSL